MLEALTGTGLATAAGLNAYIPLLVVGLLARFTNWIDLPGAWAWLSNGWVIAILAGLLLIEFVADKIPAVDSVNDIVQTVVRPTAGGMAFAAGAGSETITVSNPADLFTQKMWVPLVIGALISLTVHAGKATARPVLNVATVGMAAPVVSTAEDVTSTGISFIAILIPLLIIVVLILMVFLFFRWRRKRKARKATVASGVARSS
ncbi:DUF4126 domain-containing protein [Catelliglobosispora koreensis]|uniref:DUF4126 domain-containing protein n=1 Tax=Catelliglobosispora koreensis TaxID=129052 RepID=UPI000370F5FE|nr:DUF4126 domain-containing protein [Catelliglobosispora koreensis]